MPHPVYIYIIYTYKKVGSDDDDAKEMYRNKA
jgi:hypothetical protein